LEPLGVGRGYPLPHGVSSEKGAWKKVRIFTLEMVHSEECSYLGLTVTIPGSYRVTNRAKEMQTTHVPLSG